MSRSWRYWSLALQLLEADEGDNRGRLSPCFVHVLGGLGPWRVSRAGRVVIKGKAAREGWEAVERLKARTHDCAQMLWRSDDVD